MLNLTLILPSFTLLFIDTKDIRGHYFIRVILVNYQSYLSSEITDNIDPSLT